MKILVARQIDSQLAESGLGEQVTYRPELAEQSESALRRTLLESVPDALLVGRRLPEPSSLRAWLSKAQRTVRIVAKRRAGALPAEAPSDVILHRLEGESGILEHDLGALGFLERRLMGARTASRLADCGISPNTSPGSLAGTRVTLVGAGIVNLVSAFELVEQGAAVEILEASPDPRARPEWQRLGATHGGEDARMFCFTEADNYNEKRDRVYARMNATLRQCVTEGGWMVVPSAQLKQSEKTWIKNFQSLPRWRAEVFTQDIHRFNIESGRLWDEMRLGSPDLFQGVGYTEGILRLYSQPEKVEAAQALHGRLGSLRRVLDRAELSRRHPAFRDAVKAGEIAGAIEVVGFTLNIHRFAAKLLTHLENRGARIRWNHPVIALERSVDGSVSGLRTRHGVVRSQHYVLSPGAYGNGLLSGTRSADRIQGILGLWLLLPHLQPRLRQSVKIHREGHVGEDSNITIATGRAGEPILILGSGYGFIGSQPLDMESPQIACLFEAVEENARRFLPRAHARAVQEGTLMGSRKACVRPFTSTSLGIFEVDRTADGGRLVLTSGHNTGGFTQSPAVAKAVSTTLAGGRHPMQALYDPDRGVSLRTGTGSGRGPRDQPQNRRGHRGDELDRFLGAD